MATPKSQRVGIFIIMIVMVIGTLGSFAVMILDSNNQKDTLAQQQEQQKQFEEYQKKTEAQAKELSAKYYDEFKAYKDKPAEFNPDEVIELKTEDLKVGEGAEVTKDSQYAAYYIGWNPKGKTFDSSFDDQKENTLKQPITSDMQLIEGWTEGMQGMKIGGVREITIPSDKAYGEKGQGEDIPANTPLKFIVMAIEKPEQIEMPQIQGATTNVGQ